MTTLSSLRILANSDARVFAEAIKKFGLKVVGLRNNDPLESKVQSESIHALASTMTEDVDDPVGLSKPTIQAMRIAEEYGYIVKILAEMGLPQEDPMGGTAAPAAPPKPGVRPGVKPGRRKERPAKRKPFNPTRPQVDPDPKACGGM